jgi:hypothetical protein
MAPKIVEIEKNQDVVITIDGQVVLVLKAKPVTQGSSQAGQYDRHEFVGHGVTVVGDWYDCKYIGQAAAGMSYDVPSATVKSLKAVGAIN